MTPFQAHDDDKAPDSLLAEFKKIHLAAVRQEFSLNLLNFVRDQTEK